MSLKINILQENINSLKINYIPLRNVKQSIPHLFFPEKNTCISYFYSSKKLKEGPNPIEFSIPIRSN